MLTFYRIYQIITEGFMWSMEATVLTNFKRQSPS